MIQNTSNSSANGNRSSDQESELKSGQNDQTGADHDPSIEVSDETVSAVEAEAIDASDEVIEELNRQIGQQKDLNLRTLADMQNLKRRHASELEKARKYAIDKFAREMVEVLESLDQASEIKQTENADQTIEAMRQGVELIRKQVLTAFEKFSIVEIDPEVGVSFNPDEQQAITVVPSSDIPANHVVATYRKGYRIHERLLRPAMVIVASTTPAAATPEVDEKTQDKS